MLGVGVAAALVGKLEDVDAVERPAVRAHDGRELLGGLGQRDVEAALAAPRALDQEPQREGRLAGAGRSLEQVDAVAGQAAAEDLVEPLDAGRGASRGRVSTRPARRGRATVSMWRSWNRRNRGTMATFQAGRACAARQREDMGPSFL